MALDTTNLELINITYEDIRQNQQGTISPRQRRMLARYRLQWIAGTIGFILICATLAATILGKLVAPSLVSWTEVLLWLPVGLLWLWLLRSSPVRWRRTNDDLANSRVTTIDGKVRCELSFGIGILRMPQYHIWIGAHKFSVGKHIFFQFQNQEHYRVFYAPTATILLGAVKLRPTQTPHLPATNTDRVDSRNDSFAPVAAPSQIVVAEDDGVLVEPLTEQERAIVQLIAQGLSNKEIASELSLSTNTIKMYTSQLYKKLGVHRRTEAVARARQLQIL